MAYVSNKYKVSKQQFDQIYKNLGVNDITWETIMMVDYVYHHEEGDYNEGLSLLNRLAKKLGQFHPEWNLEEFRNRVQTNNNPMEEFGRVVQEMLNNPSDVAYYGV